MATTWGEPAAFVARCVAAATCLVAVSAPASPASAQGTPPPDVRGLTLTAAIDALQTWAAEANPSPRLESSNWDAYIWSWDAGTGSFGDHVAWQQPPSGADTDLFTVAAQRETTSEDHPVLLLGLSVQVPNLVGLSTGAATDAATAADFEISAPGGETGTTVRGQSPPAGTTVGVAADPVGTVTVTLTAPVESPPAPKVSTTPQSPSAYRSTGPATTPPGDPQTGANTGPFDGGLADQPPQLPITPLLVGVVAVGLVLLALIGRAGRRRGAPEARRTGPVGPLPPMAMVAPSSRDRRQRLIGVRRRNLAPVITVEDR